MDVSDLMSEDFLDIVWGKQEGWVDLPAKVGQYWVPWHYHYDGEADNYISGRIDSALRDQENLYFSAGMFRERGRKFDDLIPPQWLWADLDEINPLSAVEVGLQPTVAWESSAGRYQAMWRLERAIRPTVFDKLNQALSYFLGADHGGWDRTQVLRLPGTRNYKYREASLVELLWYEEDVIYQATEIWHAVRDSLPVGLWRVDQRPGGVVPRPMSPRVRSLLRVPSDAVVEGERSSTLWKIECLLAELGWSEDDIYRVVSRSAWNKWAEVGTGEGRLRTEIRKAIRHVLVRGGVSDDEREGKKTKGAGVVQGERMERGHSDGGADTGRGEKKGGRDGEDGELGEGGELVLPWVEYDRFMALAMEEPKWMIEGIWTAGSQGILGGEPKTSKTTLGLGIAMSVASGRGLFGNEEYPVRDMGGVLFVQEENAPWLIQDRVKKLAGELGLLGSARVFREKTSSGGLGDEIIRISMPDDVPLKFLHNYGIDLSNEFHREAIWNECERMQPRLVVFDPLYMVMAGVNFDKAHELAPYLKWLLALSNTFRCSVMIVHHFRKAQAGNEARPGQRLMGNATLHGFVDSALYAEQVDSDDRPDHSMLYTRVHREFRSIEPKRPLEFGIHMNPPGELGMSVEIKSYDLTARIEGAVWEQREVTVGTLSRDWGISSRIILGRARDSETINVERRKQGRGWSYVLRPTEMNGGSESPS